MFSDMLITVFRSFLVLFFVVLLFDLKNPFYFSERFSLCMGLVSVFCILGRVLVCIHDWPGTPSPAP